MNLIKLKYLTIKLIDGNIVNWGDLVFNKCYIRYYRHFTSKKHDLIMELAIVKLLDHGNIIRGSYDIHRFII
jgi:hypothetical protein